MKLESWCENEEMSWIKNGLETESRISLHVNFHHSKMAKQWGASKLCIVSLLDFFIYNLEKGTSSMIEKITNDEEDCEELENAEQARIIGPKRTPRLSN